MKHGIFGNQLHRRTNAAKALYRSLIGEVLDHGRIETTLARAKAVQGEIDHVVNWAKEGTVNSRRQIVKTLGRDVKLTRDFSDRKSGYTRIIRLGQRAADTAEMVILELVEGKEVKVEPEVKKVETKETTAETKPVKKEVKAKTVRKQRAVKKTK